MPLRATLRLPMSMRIKATAVLLRFALPAAFAVYTLTTCRAVQAQSVSGPATLWQDPAQAVHVAIAPDIPLSLVSKDLSSTRVQIMGAIMMVDLKCRLEVRNESTSFLRGVVMGVVSAEHSPGGKASVALPSLNIAPDDTTELNVDLKLVRPFPPNTDHAVNVDIDGALFTSMVFRGPNEFDSRRKLVVWEMEAERDRRHFKSLLTSGGREQLATAMQASVQRQQQRPRLRAELEQQLRKLITPSRPLVRGGRRIQVSRHHFPESPLEIVSGSALVEGSRVRAPEITVKNRSQKPVRWYELGWLVSDGDGVRYTAGLMPAPKGWSRLAPGAEASTQSNHSFVLNRGGAAGGLSIDRMSGYVRNVEFEDGIVWIPTRNDLEASSLDRATPVSVEEQRLSRLYGSQGVEAVIAELAQF